LSRNEDGLSDEISVGAQRSDRKARASLPAMSPFELHMGPHHEFAFFRGIQDGHRDHNSPENLLRPFNIEPRGQSARHSWDVAGLRLQVVMAGGSREECESWYVTLQRPATASH
jgi:hypothetical protein